MPHNICTNLSTDKRLDYHHRWSKVGQIDTRAGHSRGNVRTAYPSWDLTWLRYVVRP